MDNKRKSSIANGDGAPGTPDRVAKRRKLEEEYGDLSSGETAQSTTDFGLNMLETIRATTDKNGRAVAPIFEKLPSKTADPEYYKKVKLPLSLELLERKLKNLEYPNLSTLESDFKRLVQNAKEINPRTSEVFNDAERIRKAVSNLMVKTNPAYKSGNYQAFPTPLPASPGKDDGNDDDEEEEEEGEEGQEDESDAPGEEDDADMADANAEADEDDAEEEEEEEEEVEREPTPVKRGRRGRLSRSAAAPTPKASRSSSAQVIEQEGFKGLTFQQAQEKIIADTMQKTDQDDYLLFQPFINLPPRSLKDYYEIIAEPISLKGLQKQVRGQRGRGGASGVSDFKSWSQFEDQTSLLWKNAYHYNEDGSEISVLAKELEIYVKGIIKEAKQQVPEPLQQKIKLKVPQNTQTPSHSKKITIHVAGGKDSTTGSPAPATATPTEGETTRTGTPTATARNPFSGPAAVNHSQLDKTRSMSASAPPPSPSVAGAVKPEEAARPSPAILPPNPTLITQQQFAPVVQPIMNGVVAPPPPPPAPPKLTAVEILEAQKYRPQAIKPDETFITQFTIKSHPTLVVENPLDITVAGSTTEIVQEVVMNCPATYFRLQLQPHVAQFLEEQQREWRLNVTHDYQRLYPPQHIPSEKRHVPVFDVTLHYGLNRFEVSVLAARPKGDRGPDDLGMDLEKIVVHFNLLKHQ